MHHEILNFLNKVSYFAATGQTMGIRLENS